MKKLVFAFLASLLASGAVAQEQPAFPDIPAGHWAADAVNRIADLGIVIGFPDGTFRGNEGFTRYQAALVVSRLLEVIAEDAAAMGAMSGEDLAALREAIQELAADLAALGVRVGFVEGDLEGLRDDIAMMGDGTDMMNRLDALQMDVDAALARAQAAEDAALAGVDPMIAEQIEANARGIANLNEVVAQLTQEVDALRAGVPGEVDTTFMADIDRNMRDIANLREFVILLRRDQVALRERVAALEEQVSLFEGLDERVAALEASQITFSGSVTLSLTQGTLGGDMIAFDVDRIFGAGQQRNLANSVFSTGADGDVPARERADIFQTPAAFATDFAADFGFGEGRGGAGVGGLDEFDAVVDFGLRRAFNLCANADCTSTFNGYVFELRNVISTVDVAGVGPIQFQFGEAPSARFTPYVFQTLGPGFVATIGAPDFLDFLSPTVTVAYGIARRTVDIDGTNVQVLGPAANYFGVRATLSPFAGLTLGVSLAQLERGDAGGSATGVFGVDANISLGFVSLAGEYAQSQGVTLTTNADGLVIGNFGSATATDLYYVTATVAGDSIPLLNSLSANYRNMPVRDIGHANTTPGFFGIEFGGAGDKPFRFDQEGFGVNASVNLFILDVNAYFDSYTIPSNGNDVLAYGAETEVGLFAGFAARGFFRQAFVNGEEVRNLGGFDGNARTQNYASELGAGLRHDGAAEDALIDGLNLNFEFALLGPGFETSRITVGADYSLTIAGFTLDPYVSFVSRAFNDIDGADTTIRAGTGIMTDPLDIFLSPSLNAAVNFRSSDIDPAAGGVGVGAYTATELQYSVGVTLNEFLFDNSRLTARYGSYMGTNMSVERRANPADADVNQMTNVNVATRAHAPADLGGAMQTTMGFELVWDYFDLEFAYGMYSHTITGGTVPAEDTTGNRFRIRYVVNF